MCPPFFSLQEYAMPTLTEIVRMTESLTPQEREQLARVLTVRGPELPLVSPATAALARPDIRDPVGWRKAEAGHAVLAIETPEREDEIPAGPPAIAGIWVDRSDL
jgi:hypothetical protein